MTTADYKFKETSAPATSGLLEHIRKKAELKGMKVNEPKTGLMCVSAARSFEAKAAINFNGQRVSGTESMKILGVTLDRDCSFGSHVQEVSTKLRMKTWALSNLRRKGMREEDMVEAYKTTIRPSAKYASQVWHPLLTVGQSEHIERQQTQALKNIYGIGMSANKMRKKANLERLWNRRERSCFFFAQKKHRKPEMQRVVH